MPKGTLHLLTDTELLEIKPTIMDWAMRRVLRDKEDAEIKETIKQQEREKKANRAEEIDEESGVGEPSRLTKRARTDIPVQDEEDDSDNNDIVDVADPNGRQEKTQEHKKARTRSQLEEDTPVVNTTAGIRRNAPS